MKGWRILGLRSFWDFWILVEDSRLHTQITEQIFYAITYSELFSLCIEHLPECYSVRPSLYFFWDLDSPLVFCDCFPNPDWSFREHLSHALPTEMIFYLFRSNHSERLIRRYSTKSVLDMLEIMKWLRVSVSKCKQQTPQTKKPICV